MTQTQLPRFVGVVYNSAIYWQTSFCKVWHSLLSMPTHMEAVNCLNFLISGMVLTAYSLL